MKGTKRVTRRAEHTPVTMSSCAGENGYDSHREQAGHVRQAAHTPRLTATTTGEAGVSTAVAYFSFCLFQFSMTCLNLHRNAVGMNPW